MYLKMYNNLLFLYPYHWTSRTVARTSEAFLMLNPYWKKVTTSRNMDHNQQWREMPSIPRTLFSNHNLFFNCELLIFLEKKYCFPRLPLCWVMWRCSEPEKGLPCLICLKSVIAGLVFLLPQPSLIPISYKWACNSYISRMKTHPSYPWI